MSGCSWREIFSGVGPAQRAGTRPCVLIAAATLGSFLPAVLLADNDDVQIATAKRTVVADGPVQLSVEIDKPVARVAEPIRLVLQVDAPRGTRVKMPALSEHLGPFEVLAKDQANDLPVDNTPAARRWLLHVTLETIKTGAMHIPRLDVQYVFDDRSGAYKTLRSEPLSVRITSVLENRADPTDFRDIKEVVDVDVPEPESYAWLWWTLGGVGTMGAVALAAIFAAKWKRRQSPAEWALAEIAQLEAHDVLQAAGAEATYDELVEIVREFVELQWDLPARAQTTPDFLAQAADEACLSDNSREQLQALLAIADEVKFARLKVGAEQTRQAMGQARQFIAECARSSKHAGKEAA